MINKIKKLVKSAPNYLQNFLKYHSVCTKFLKSLPLSFSMEPSSEMIVGERKEGELSLANNMADMTKIRTQLDRKEYTKERDKWADKV